MSSKGQLHVPIEVRRKLGLREGMRMRIVVRGADVVLSPINEAEAETARRIAAAWTVRTGRDLVEELHESRRRERRRDRARAPR